MNNHTEKYVMRPMRRVFSSPSLPNRLRHWGPLATSVWISDGQAMNFGIPGTREDRLS